ncbi:MAG: 1-deoxy-D-xylulose-5-phosphate reductoisomerase, partial [Candidatus Zixiibacteriota bacterium]
KESLVAGGPLFKSVLARSEGKLLPIDSEHSAIWQATRCGHPCEVRKILLTSSGGPFRTWPKEKFREITVEAALNHPTWKMGPKITIDSATLANKGLEVIEAVYLFEVAPEQIEVVIHPQSVIHSMVEFTDSSTIAQLSLPDMRLPITYALFFPERVESDFGRIDWQELSSLTFEAPDMDRFPALRLAYQAVRTGGTAPAVYNAANEVAVAGFLEGVVSFTSISDIIADTLDELVQVTNPELDDILEADRKARDIARRVLEKVT